MNRVCSIFRQILQFVPRLEFEAAVKKHKAERHARGFRCWDQFVAMMFCQLGHAQSLREITGGLARLRGQGETPWHEQCAPPFDAGVRQQAPPLAVV